MKKILAAVLVLTSILAFAGCGNVATTSQSAQKAGSPMSKSESYTDNNRKINGDVEGNKVISAKITVGNKVLNGKFYDNETTQALVSKLPMTVNMTELNGKEKYYHLSEHLPAKSTVTPAIINAGEIMCWSSNTLVLFYNTYSNSYGGYVKIGYIEDISGLKEALGNGNVQVTFEVAID
jgi:hypothetical protein